MDMIQEVFNEIGFEGKFLKKDGKDIFLLPTEKDVENFDKQFTKAVGKDGSRKLNKNSKLQKDLMKALEETVKVSEKKVVEEVEEENREVKLTDRVVVMNNINNPLGFQTSNGRDVSLARRGQTREITVDDLEHIMSIAPAMLTQGMLYVEDKAVREFLYIDDRYEDGSIVHYKDIEKMLEMDVKEMEEKIQTASDSTKRELIRVACTMRDDLTGSQVKALERTGHVVFDAIYD